jgi:AraC-like DNA-binding protein
MAAMVAPVEQDARGIVSPATGLTRFRLDRFAPSPAVARLVDRYWVASWDLTGQPSHTQQILAHPAVNVVLSEGTATITGVATRMGSRTLAGAGRAVGVLFRPAGFRPLLDRPLSSLTDAVVPAAEVLGGSVDDLAVASTALAAAEAVAAFDALLAAAVPAGPHPAERTSALVERIAGDPSVVRVEPLAAEVGLSVRQLQRRFADHVGLSPKAVIRRYRLFEAAERARRAEVVDWAALAAELRYSDQPHLVRDFRATFGLPPEQYARVCAAAAQSR